MRIRPRLLTAALLFTAAGLMPLAHADPTADAEKAIQAICAKSDAAAANKDVNAILASVSPDFKATTPKGKTYSLAQWKNRWTMLVTAGNSISAKTTIQKFSLQGSDALATTSRHVQGVTVDPNTNKTLKIVADVTSDDTWVKNGKSWLLKRSKITSDKITVNGKPYH